MHSILNRLPRILRLAVALFPLVGLAVPAHADIFQWEYVNPADPSQGKRQSTTLAPDGAGVDAVPNADLSGRDLTMAYLTSADLTQAILANAYLYFADLTDATFRDAILIGASLSGATLADADFTGAQVRGANLGKRFHDYDCLDCFTPVGYYVGTGITLAQLSSTASYQARDLSGINLTANDLAGGNFAGQNLTNATFESAVLTGTDLTGAVVRGANFRGAGITLEQIYSTASYHTQDLAGVGLGDNDLSGGNFGGQDLSNANFAYSTLTDANFADATIRGSNFNATVVNLPGPYCRWSPGGCTRTLVGGITLSQLYSTDSYQLKDLSGISLGLNNLAGANFVGQDLANANFYLTTITGADFTGADVHGADFSYASITLEQLYSTSSYEAHDLRGLGLAYSHLSGGNFAEQNLENAYLYFAIMPGSNFRYANLANSNLMGTVLHGSDFTGADVRGAYGSPPPSATTINLIRRDGHISGLDLDIDGLLVVRDHDGGPYFPYFPIPITVDQHLTMAPGGALRMVFEVDAWDSTISFAPGIPVTLGGTLELTFANDVNLSTQLGRTFHLFDWTGVTPTGTFAVASPYAWDLSRLYTSGEVTLLAIPEPPTTAVICVIIVAIRIRRRSALRSSRPK